MALGNYDYLDVLRWAFVAATVAWVIALLLFTRLYFIALKDGNARRDPFILSNAWQGIAGAISAGFYTYTIWFEQGNIGLARFALLMLPLGMFLQAVIHSAVVFFAQRGRRT